MTLIQSDRDKAAKNWFVAVAVILALVVIASSILFGMFGSFNGNNSDASASLKGRTAEPSATPTPSPTPSAEECEPEFTQIALDRKGSPKVNPNFQAEYDAVAATGISDPERATLLVTSGHNGALLATYAHQVGLFSDQDVKDTSKVATLIDGNCLSKDGKSLYNKLDGAYHMAGVTFAVVDEAPANGTNSGVDANGNYGVAEGRGITGDRKAIEITLPNGTKTWVMFRCGNPVFLGSPNLPHVPTDNPPPVVVVTPPPPAPPHVNPKNIAEAPQRTGNLPVQQAPNVLPATPEMAQPSKPADPPAVYVPPAAAPAPTAAPVQTPTGPIAAPTPEPVPVVIPPAEPTLPNTPTTPATGCSPAPGRSC